jgi:hypothetical protein
MTDAFEIGDRVAALRTAARPAPRDRTHRREGSAGLQLGSKAISQRHAHCLRCVLGGELEVEGTFFSMVGICRHT